ncbi:MAG: DNA alkylation repair protein [Gammaproteobacteria bacterium]|nr:DNA alkylation repair protein [Gammaproteobacteria bacterium]
MHNLESVHKKVIESIDSTSAHVARFFKTGAGEYGEHDSFLGVTVPTIRKLVKIFENLTQYEIAHLLSSKFNEERLLALLILVKQYQKGSAAEKEAIYNFYLTHTDYVNNWNLVDSSAHHIVGEYLFSKDILPLIQLSNSSILWERRIAIVATWYFIRQSKIQPTFTIAQTLFNDREDLIHKATGWMLHECGKKNESAMIKFLTTHIHEIPRTALRYAIERLPSESRSQIMMSNQRNPLFKNE